MVKDKATPNRQLEAARLKKRWSVEVASKKVGVSVNTFNRWERGLQLPHLHTLDLLCKAFDMSSDELGFTDIITAKRRTKASIQEPVHTDHLVTDEQQPAIVALQEKPIQVPLLQQASHGLSLEESKKSQNEIHPLHQYDHIEGKEDVTRKQAIALLVSVPTAVFELTQKTKEPLLYADEILSSSSVSLSFCWQLYYEGGFAELNRILPGYITPLSSLTQRPSHYQEWAANLASQVHQLSYLLALQSQDFGISLKHTQEAARYGLMAGDPNLQAASLARRAYIYFCLRRRKQRLQTYQEALRYCTESSPLLKGYIYAGLAEAYAISGDDTRAHEFLKQAYENYPDRPEEDPAYSYTHFRWPTLYNFAGQVYLHVNKPGQAWEAFATVDRLVPASEEPYRVELTVYQAATALDLGELEQSCALIEKAVKAARILGSNLRYNEAVIIYERIQEKWGQEAPVKALTDLFNSE